MLISKESEQNKTLVQQMNVKINQTIEFIEGNKKNNYKFKKQD